MKCQKQRLAGGQIASRTPGVKPASVTNSRDFQTSKAKSAFFLSLMTKPLLFNKNSAQFLKSFAYMKLLLR